MSGLLRVGLADGSVHLDDPDGALAERVRHQTGQRALDVVREPDGNAPLFQARVGEEIVVADDLHALVAVPGVRASPDPLHVAEWLLGACPDPSATLLAGVQRVPPGHVLEVRASGTALRRTWRPPPPGTYGDVEALGRFGSLLEEAVRRATGGRRAAVLLSGGVDSAAVAAALARSCERPGGHLALCVVFEEASEEETQRTVARALGLEVRTARASPAEPALLARALARAASSLWPTSALWAPVYDLLIAEARDDGVTVVIDGLGGDELLDAGPAGGRALRRRPRALAAWLLAERRYVSSARSAARGLLRGSGRQAPAIPAWLAPERQLRDALTARATSPPAGFEALRDADLIDPLLLAARESNHCDTAGDGVERRSPLWDASIVDLLHGLDPALLVAGGQPKAPARRYLRPHVPALAGTWPRPLVADRLYAGLVGEMTRLTEGTLPRLEELGVVDRADRRAPFPSGLLWTILSLEAWLEGLAGR